MIPQNDFRRQWADTGEEVLKAVTCVGESGWYILGAQVKRFEQELAQFWGVRHTVGVASGLDAIELSLRALGCGAGDYVLTSPISAFATTLAILKTGATPVFADCDEYGLIDLAECRKTLERRRDIRFCVPVHLYGHSLNLAELRSLQQDFELAIVEDCAQSIGATWQSAATGSVGQFAATSFYPTKNLGALGDGGAILTNSEEAVAQVRCLRDYGQSAKYVHQIVGYNSRLDELHAAILSTAFLPRLAHCVERRREIAAAYLEGLSTPRIRPVGAPAGSDSCWHLFPVLVEAEDKGSALAHFKARGIVVGEHYPLAIIEQPAVADLRGRSGSDCTRAIDFCRRELSLPIHPYLTDGEVQQVIQACNDWR